MKVRIQLLAVTVMTLMGVNTRANVNLQVNKAFYHSYSFVTKDGAKMIIVPFTIPDPLLMLQKNYPSVYTSLLHDFKDVASLSYSAEGSSLFISFTSNSTRIFAVYTTEGEFRYSIAYIGSVLPRTITEQLGKAYPAWTVFYGKEIRTNNKDFHQVVIENQNEYRVIDFFDTEMQEIKRVRK